jgi:hypothetical protein
VPLSVLEALKGNADSVFATLRPLSYRFIVREALTVLAKSKGRIDLKD